MKKLDSTKMQNLYGGQSLTDRKTLQAPGAYLVCFAGTLVACATGGPLGLIELAACGYTLYKNW